MLDSGWRGRAPGRVNLIGEHVDYAGGLVLPCAIDRFVSVQGSPAGSWEASSEDADGTAYVRAVGEALGARPQRCWIESDLPVGAGLSSSAALLVATCHGLAPELGGRDAALLCQRAEHVATGVMVGVMDQFACALAQRGHALLLDCATLAYEHVPFPDGVVLAVMDSGVRRQLGDTAYNQRRQELEAGMPARVRHVETEIERVREFAQAMRAGDRRRMGELLDESHRSLRDDFEVSIPALDELCGAARRAPGCLGARLIGAGFGGSALALIDAGQELDFEAAMPGPVLVVHTTDGAYAGRG